MIQCASIPISFLRECLIYEEDRGLVWRERPHEHFVDAWYCEGWNKKFAGKQVSRKSNARYHWTTITCNGYRFRVAYYQIVWALHFGEWPKDEIDHEDGNTHNDKVDNLREATHAQNHQNIPMPRPYYDKRRNKWGLNIKVNGRRIYLGQFDTPEAAQEAYLAAKAEVHTFQPKPRLAVGP